MLSKELVTVLSRLSLDEVDVVGFDLASMGELFQHNVSIPDAVVVMPHAFEEFKLQNND